MRGFEDYGRVGGRKQIAKFSEDFWEKTVFPQFRSSYTAWESVFSAPRKSGCVWIWVENHCSGPAVIWLSCTSWFSCYLAASEVKHEPASLHTLCHFVWTSMIASFGLSFFIWLFCAGRKQRASDIPLMAAIASPMRAMHKGELRWEPVAYTGLRFGEYLGEISWKDVGKTWHFVMAQNCGDDFGSKRGKVSKHVFQPYSARFECVLNSYIYWRRCWILDVRLWTLIFVRLAKINN